MTQRKQMDVYIYMITTNALNIEREILCLMPYCIKKTTRLTGVFIDYCTETQPLETRQSFQNLINIKKQGKFIVCCSDKSDFPDIDYLENTIKAQGGKIHYYWDTVKERNAKAIEKQLKSTKL